ncbi:MAG: hypothetical protein WBG58_08970 [Ignavibacteriaceae bacterium]
MSLTKKILAIFIIISISISFNSCGIGSEPKPRLSMFIGVDISGSFINSKYFDDSIDFLAHYINAHLNGYGGLDVPKVLFVGSIGGEKQDEPKTLYPISDFENKSIVEIREQLKKSFPNNKFNPFTDYNAFFDQIARTVRDRNLILKPISIVMISDGIPDVPTRGKKKADFEDIIVKPLELLARNITIRLLYTDAVVGKDWQTKVSRKRVKIWTQDAQVMESWKDPNILLPDTTYESQERFFKWIKDNVDFGVRSRRVD